MRRLLAPVVLLSLALATPALAGEWSQGGHDAANTNVADPGSPITSTTVGSLDAVWTRNLNGAPVVHGGQVFVDTRGNRPLEILDLVTGATTATIDDHWFQGPAAVSGDTVVVQRPTLYRSDGTVSAQPAVAGYSITTGTQRWQVLAGVERITGGMIPPTIAAGKVFPGGYGNDPDRPAIDLATGTVVYRTSSGADWATKVVVGAGIVATVRGESGGNVLVYDVDDGTFLWRARRIDAALTLGGDRLIVSKGKSVAAFDAVTGTRLWKRTAETLGGVAVTGSMVIGVAKATTNGVVTGADLRAWSLADGHLLWSDPVGGTGVRFTDPVVVNGITLVGRWQPGGPATVLAFKRTTGGALVELPVGAGPIGALAIVDDTLLVPAGGVLHALRVSP